MKIDNVPFDYIIAGGGASGLSLAYQITQSSLRDKRILIIDKEHKNKNDHTWCYWANHPYPFDQIAFRKWNSIKFKSQTFENIIPLRDYWYYMIKAVDFYEFVYKTLAQFSNIQFIYSPINQIVNGDRWTSVHTENGIYHARWIFDSIFMPQQLKVDESKYHFLKQHFLGWEIESDQPIFNPQTMTLFDFCIAQEQDMHFMYVLPYNQSSGLVELTFFSYNILEKDSYRQILIKYLQGLTPHYKVKNEEFGIIPMTDQPFPIAQGKRVINIGTKGGMVKPSTGYAFRRIQDQNAAIIRSLINNDTPFTLPSQSVRYRLFDSILLHILYRQSNLSEEIFTEIFKKNSIDRIFRFLDEEGSILENIEFFASLNPKPFIQAFYQYLLLKRI